MLVAATMFSMACKSPDELIVGKWVVDYLSLKKGAVPDTLDTYSLQEKEAIIRESNAFFTFDEQNNCTIGGQGLEASGTYAITGDTLWLNLAGDQPQTAIIVSISASKLTLSFDSPRFPKELVHFKKQALPPAKP